MKTEEFTKIVEFKQKDTNMLEVFFFKEESLVDSKFMTKKEFSMLS